mmetsp:Transcript_8819/g.15030  ORF Transcript_8819/g.15030 Transcript_8819/m.15030 type:complete len:171 (-) Transcript_8819:612-1124(-)
MTFSGEGSIIAMKRCLKCRCKSSTCSLSVQQHLEAKKYLQSNFKAKMALLPEEEAKEENCPANERANVIFSAIRRSIFVNKEPKVSFSNSVKIKFVPFYHEYGEGHHDEIWWNKSDYQAFQEVAIRFVQMFGSLKNIIDEDHAHDEPMLILNHRVQTPSVPKSRYCSTQA